MALVDCNQPDVVNEFGVSGNNNKIVRKPKDIVNVSYEFKVEDFAWFYLFPYGINHLKEKKDL